MDSVINRYEYSDFTEIAEFLEKTNNKPDQYSGYCSKTKKAILRDMKQGYEDNRDIVIVSRQNGLINGAITCHFNNDSVTADCCGPYISEEGMTQENLPEELYMSLLDSIEKPVTLQFFFSEKNRICLELMKKIKAENKGREIIMNLKRKNIKDGQMNSELDLPVTELIDTEQKKNLMNLHDKIFPESYVSGKEIISSCGNDRKVYIIENKNEIIGYGVLRHAQGDIVATAEILAVKDDYRGRGYGKILLEKIITEGFKSDEISEMELVVEENNLSATALYRKMGFTVRDINCSYAFDTKKKTRKKKSDIIHRRGKTE